MDYYKVLGVEKNAPKDEIKKAFHKLAHKYHPDKKGGDEKKFKEINEAYQVLSDDGKRAQYDTYGSNFQNAAGGGAGGGFSGFQGGNFGFDFSDIFRQAGSGRRGGVEDIFESFFGGAGPRGGGRRGKDISVDILISFSESIFGVERKVRLNKIGVCDACEGKGAKKGSSMIKCKACGGKGKVIENKRSFLGTFQMESVCESCQGAGETPKEVCSVCSGEGVMKKSEELSVKVPAGIEDGEMIRYSGRGEAISKGTPGDLYIKIHVEKHPTWRREGINLVSDLNIKLTDAVLGATYNLKTLEGDIPLKIPAGISSGEILRIKGKGVPISGEKRGDLLVHIKIKIPTGVSKKDAELFNKLRENGL